MNIDELYTLDAHEAGAEMQVKDASGNDTDIYLKLAGIDSKTWKKEFSRSRKNIIDGVDDADAELYSSVTIGWRGVAENGKELKFSKDRVKQLYINAPYILQQADKFVADRANFIRS